MKKLIMAAAAVSVAVMVAEADVRLAPVFGDKMVLQRDMPVRVWGYADPREMVVVRFADQKKTVVASDWTEVPALWLTTAVGTSSTRSSSTNRS